MALTIPDLEELNYIFLKHCDLLKFEIKTKNDSRIEFLSFDELSGYSNFNETKILALTIKGFLKDNKYSNVVKIEFRQNYPYVDDNIECYYSFENEDKEKVLIWDLNDFLKRRKCYNNLAFIVKLSAQILTFLLFISPLLFKKVRLNLCEFIIGPFQNFKLAMLLLIPAMLIILIVIPPISKILFPDILFLWGEAGKTFERRKRWLSNIFWIVIGIVLDRLIGFFL